MDTYIYKYMFKRYVHIYTYIYTYIYIANGLGDELYIEIHTRRSLSVDWPLNLSD